MSLQPFDARLPALLARLRAAPTDAQAGLRRHAEVIAWSCGRTLDQAIAEIEEAAKPIAKPKAPEIDSLAITKPCELPTQPKQPKSRPASQDGPAISISDHIAAELRANPAATDRSIARRLDCSPTMPGRVRRALGIAAPVRSVHRGKQRYDMTAHQKVRTAAPTSQLANTSLTHT